MSEYIVVFDVGPFVQVMTDEEECVERGKKFSTREEAREAARGHMLGAEAYVLRLEDDDE